MLTAAEIVARSGRKDYALRAAPGMEGLRIARRGGRLNQQAELIISAARPEQFPPEPEMASGAEVAFLGRSNVGKSSLLNA